MRQFRQPGGGWQQLSDRLPHLDPRAAIPHERLDLQLLRIFPDNHRITGLVYFHIDSHGTVMLADKAVGGTVQPDPG